MCPCSRCPTAWLAGRRLRHGGAIVALALSLAACGGSAAQVTPVAVSDGAATIQVTAAPAPPATPVGGFGDERVALGAVQWALALDPETDGPRERVTAVPVDAPRFWAVVPLVRATSGLRLRAEWSYNGTPMPALAAETVVPEGGAGFAVFDLALPAGERWPVGDYAVSISVDGVPALSASIPVVSSAA